MNKACEEFEFEKLNIDHFKCLIFVCGRKAPRYADVRARLLSRIEGETAEAPATLQTLIDDFQRLINLKSDTTMIEHPSSSKNSYRSISEKKPGNQQRSRKRKASPPLVLPAGSVNRCTMSATARFLTISARYVTASVTRKATVAASSLQVTLQLNPERRRSSSRTRRPVPDQKPKEFS